MESVHTIRLREPWEQHPNSDGCLHRRTFHTPTGIDSGDTVWIVVESQEFPARLYCNGTLLGSVHRQAAFEITPLLESPNHLELHFAPSETNPQRGSVCLEIRCKRNV